MSSGKSRRIMMRDVVEKVRRYRKLDFIIYVVASGPSTQGVSRGFDVSMFHFGFGIKGYEQQARCSYADCILYFLIARW